MTIQFTANAPLDTHTKIDQWLPDIQQVSSTGGGAEGEVTNLSDGYEVRYLSVDKIASGELVNAIHASCWRHLVMSGSHIHGEIELDDSHEPVALHTGIGKDGLQAALYHAEKLDGNYEVCVLHSSHLKFVGLWLHNESKDWIMPYPPNATSLANYQTVTIDDVLAVLQPMARDVLESSATDEPTGG